MRETLLVLSLLLASVALPRLARAGERASEHHAAPAQDGAPVDRDEPERETGHGVDIGVLGGVGFPRPLAVEALLRLDKTLVLGAEYGFMPNTTIESIDVRLWSAAATLRYFPFKGAFFIGLRGGHQSVSAETTLSAANIGAYTESVSVRSWFLNPRVGFLWVWKPIALGIDIGLQIPLSTTVSRSSLLAAASPEIDATITRATDTLGRSVIPTVDLLKIGIVF